MSSRHCRYCGKALASDESEEKCPQRPADPPSPSVREAMAIFARMESEGSPATKQALQEAKAHIARAIAALPPPSDNHGGLTAEEIRAEIRDLENRIEGALDGVRHHERMISAEPSRSLHHRKMADAYADEANSWRREIARLRGINR